MSMKTITVIQKVMLMLCALLVVSACSYDDEEIWNKVNDHEARISALEDWQAQVNNNIAALQELLNTQDYITKVSPLVENGVEVGYSIYFAKSDSIALYHGIKGEDGVDGYVPAISVKKDTDGIYYWTLDGDWLTDSEGHKIKAEGTDGKDGADGEDGKDGQDGEDGKDGANGSNGHNGTNGRDGITPKLKIEEGTWYVSYDKGATWEKLGVAIIEDGGDSGETTACTCPITDVDVQTDKVIFTLDSGDEFEVPYYEESDDELTITFENTTIYLGAGEKEELTYTLSMDDIKVYAIGEGVRTELENGKLTIIAPSEYFEGGKVLVHATDGKLVATVEINVIIITYVDYNATTQLIPGYEYTAIYLPSKSTHDPVTGDGRVALKGIVDDFDGLFSRMDTNSKKDLTKVVVPEGVTEIKGDAFTGCYNLKTITFPSTLKEIGNFAFAETSLSGEIVIPEGVVSIGTGAFRNSNTAAKFTFTKISLPESLETIGERAFANCEALEEIVIPDKVKRIEDQTFSYCTSLKTVVLGVSVEYVGYHAFNECEAIETITCKNPTPAEYDADAFLKGDGWDSYTYTIYVPKGAKSEYDAKWTWVKNTGWENDKITIEEQE